MTFSSAWHDQPVTLSHCASITFIDLSCILRKLP